MATPTPTLAPTLAPTERLDLPRTLKIGSFHCGSAATELLISGVWNRVLITDLGLAATPVALLAALRYLLAPLSVWAGDRSDRHPLFGYRRLPYIWGGRALMLLGLMGLPVSTLLLAEDGASVAGWSVALLAFMVYGVGSLGSGSPFLALLRDRTPPARRGQALSVAQIMMLVSMVLLPALYGALMKTYDPAAFLKTVLIGAGLALPFWFFSVLGEDRPVRPRSAPAPAAPEVPPAPAPAPDPARPAGDADPPLPALIRRVWADIRTRSFFLLLALGSIGAFAQDAILEPFGGEVFGMTVGQTTLFNAWWGIGVLFGMILTAWLTRRRAPAEQTPTARLGLVLTAVPLASLALIAALRIETLLHPTLLLFGLGFGVYTVGAIGLLMAMTTDRHAGAYLGLWTVGQLVFRGLGIALGGLLLDLGRLILPAPHLAYAAIFLMEALLLLVCLRLLARVDAPGFAAGRTLAPGSALALGDD